MINLTCKQHEIISDNSPLKIIQGVRQSGKSYLLKHIALMNAFFSSNKVIYVTCLNHMSSKQFTDDLKDMYMSIPSLLRPGVTIWNRQDIKFSNGSTIMTGVANSDSTCDLNIDLLLMDDVAFYKESDVCDFWDRSYPRMHNKEIIISSTRFNRSKRNFFWRTWLGAGIKNDFRKFTISNKDVTFKDSRWFSMMRANMGKNLYYKEFIIKNS